MRPRLLFLAAAVSILAACQTTPVVTQDETAQTEPLGVAAEVSDKPSEGMTENDWGGEVPQTKPAGEVSDGGLEDLD